MDTGVTLPGNPSPSSSALSSACVCMPEIKKKKKKAFCANPLAAGELEVAGFSASKISAVTVAINCQVRAWNNALVPSRMTAQRSRCHKREAACTGKLQLPRSPGTIYVLWGTSLKCIFFFLPLPLDLGSVHSTSALILTAWLNSPSLLLRVFDKSSKKHCLSSGFG